MEVKVYGSLQSSCTQRVMACLLEKGVDFALVPINLEAREHKMPEFLRRQPFGQVPAIEDGDLKLFESRAIIRYYATKYADRGTNLLGKTWEEKALVEQWLEVEAQNLNVLVYNMVFNLLILPRMGQKGDMELVRNSEEKIEKVLDIYEKRLKETSYLAGDSFTLADLTNLPGLGYLMQPLGKSHFIRDRKNVNAWWEKISNRPSWKKLMKLLN